MNIADYEAMLISALRYALPRQSYMTLMTVDFITKEWKYLSPGTRAVMLQDLREALLEGRPPPPDFELWTNFHKECIANALVPTIPHAEHAALRATLLFHSGTPWSDIKRRTWFELTGSNEATTKSLCDFIRSELAHEHGDDINPTVERVVRLDVELAPVPNADDDAP